MSSRETESDAKVSGVATEQGELKDEEMNSDGSEREQLGSGDDYEEGKDS